MSYFEGYVNLRGDRTLRAYSRPVNLARFDRAPAGLDDDRRRTSGGSPSTWSASPTPGCWRPAMVRRLRRVDRRSLDAALVGYREPAR